MGSRGSVIPFFMSKVKEGTLPITDNRMTRFMITLEDGVKLVWEAFDEMIESLTLQAQEESLSNLK